MATKKIIINALYIKWGNNGGTETYLTNIVEPWYKDNATRIEILLLARSAPPWWNGNRKHFKLRIIPLKSILKRILYEQLIAPLIIYNNFNLIFSPGYVGSFLSSKQQLVTVHDCFAWSFPNSIGIMKSLYWKTFIPLSAKRRSTIIAVSKSTKEDLLKFTNIKKNTIKVIYEAGNNILSNKNFLQINLPVNYFHCVGFFKEIKNPFLIIEAYKLYRSKSLNPFNLLLIGVHKNKTGKELKALIHGIKEIKLLGYVNENELSMIYKKSKGLIFTSLYEGFGIPILEAQSCSCPVITSNCSSMPEIAGSGALIVDPYNIEEIAMAMMSLEIKDTRNKLISNGNVNLKRFNWAKSSYDTLNLINSIIEHE